MSVNLEYFNGKTWSHVSEWHNEALAWISLGSDDVNYRTVDKKTKKVLTDKRIYEPVSTVQVSTDTIKAAIKFMEQSAVNNDYLYGQARTLQELIEANKMPNVYYELLGVIV